MRTEQDIRDVFDQLARTAPQSIEPPARRPRRTRPVLATALATAATAIAAIAVPQVVSNLATTPAGQSRQDSAWAQWINLNLPTNVYATTQLYKANRQDYELYRDNGNPWPTYCELQVHRNGDFDPARIPAGSPAVDIDGQQGRLVTSTRTTPFPPLPLGYRFAPALDTPLKTVVWQPSDGLWALLTCESQRRLGSLKVPKIDGPFDPDVPLALQLAKASASGAAKLGSPFVLRSLPDGLTARRITYAPAKGNFEGAGNDFAVMFGDGNPGTGYQKPQPRAGDCSIAFVGKPPKACLDSGNQAYTPQVGDDLEIRYSTGTLWNAFTRASAPVVTTIHGMKMYYVYGTGLATSTTKSGLPEHDAVRLEGNGVGITIRSLDAHPSLDKLRQIAESLNLTTSSNNPGRWFDAMTAIP